jgi:nucleoside-triphosphatase
MIKSLTAQI